MITFAITYCLFIFLLIRFLVTLSNFITKPLLPKVATTNAATSLSILIPARNEENNLATLLPNLCKFSNLHVKEIIVLDDFSNDQTANVVQTYLKQDNRLRLVLSEPLPIEWLGKNWACHQLSKKATSDFMLYIDADVVLTDEVITSSLHRMEENKLDLLSIFPDQKMDSLGEKLIVPLMHFLLLNLLPLRLVRISKNPAFSAANGQFMLFRTKTYRHYQFHEMVKSNILDDVNIMKAAKKKGLVGEVLLANKMVFCKMYHSGREAFNGFSKNLFLGFGKNSFGFLTYLFLISVGWMFLAMHRDLTLCLISIVLVLLNRIFISILANQSVVNSLILHPIQMLFYVLIGLNSMYVHSTDNIIWKGRKI